MRVMPPITLADFDAASFRFEGTGTFSCTPARLFEELGEPARWTSWFPLMRRARWTSDATARAGAEREVSIVGFGRFRETILEFRPGERFAFTMIASTSPLARTMGEDYRLTALGDRTRLDWTLVASPTSVGRFVMPMMPRILAPIWRRAVRNLERLVTLR